MDAKKKEKDNNVTLTKKNYEKVLSSRIDKGIEVLDKEIGREKWLKKIDLISLDLQKSHVCICGQVFGDYWDTVLKGISFRDDAGSEGVGRTTANKLGFNLEVENSDFFDVLTHMWFCRLTAMKAKSKLTVKRK